MKNSNLGFIGSIACAVRGVAFDAIHQMYECERLATEISAIAQLQMDEVKAYYRTHNISLETIKNAVSMGIALDDDLQDNYTKAMLERQFGNQILDAAIKKTEGVASLGGKPIFKDG